MIRISGLHLLLTYQCTYECEHCFVWGSPKQSGVMAMRQVDDILTQAAGAGIEEVYFEGGEPFLYYTLLKHAVAQAAAFHFSVGIVTNAYWAVGLEDAIEALQPFAGHVHDLSVSSDLYHADERISRQARFAAQAAQQLGIPCGLIQVAPPETGDALSTHGRIESGDEAGLMYRGRAVSLAQRAPQHPWEGFTTCPHENLKKPGRIHVDPLGYLHLCHGLTIGNLFDEPLTAILARCDPAQPPIAGPLLAGGPAELARRYGISPRPSYADACHLCDESRRALRAQFESILTPDQMYGCNE
jgi:hypothetical protein